MSSCLEVVELVELRSITNVRARFVSVCDETPYLRIEQSVDRWTIPWTLLSSFISISYLSHYLERCCTEAERSSSSLLTVVLSVEHKSF